MPKSPCFFFAHVRMYIFMATPLRASFPSWGPAVLPLCGLNSAGPLRAPAVLGHMKLRSIRSKEMKEDRNNAE